MNLSSRPTLTTGEASWSLVILSVTIFTGQAACCWSQCAGAAPRVNAFYKVVTTLHLLAMAPAFPLALLLRAMPIPLRTVLVIEDPSEHSRDHGDSVRIADLLFDGTYSRATGSGEGREGAMDGAYPTAASYAFLSLLALFSLHSVSNCCRVIFDACGERAAKSAVIPAALIQLWLLWPALTFTFTLQMILLILIATDYVQTFVGCTFWAAVACTEEPSSAGRARACYGICGGALHMLSAAPLVGFHVATFDGTDAYNTTEEADDQGGSRVDQWISVPLVGLAVGLMGSAQVALSLTCSSTVVLDTAFYRPRPKPKPDPKPNLLELVLLMAF